MNEFGSIFTILFGAIIFSLGVYNCFYFIQAQRAQDRLGIAFPQTVKKMLVVNIFLPIITLSFIILSSFLF